MFNRVFAELRYQELISPKKQIKGVYKMTKEELDELGVGVWKQAKLKRAEPAIVPVTIKNKIKIYTIIYNNQDRLLFLLSVYNNEDAYSGCELVTINLLPYLHSKNIKDELKQEIDNLIISKLYVTKSEYVITQSEHIFNRLETIISYWKRNTLKMQQYISTELAHIIIDSEGNKE